MLTISDLWNGDKIKNFRSASATESVLAKWLRGQITVLAVEDASLKTQAGS